MTNELDLTKKLDFGAIFEWTFKLFKRHFLFLVRSMSYFFIPGLIVLTGLIVLIYPSVLSVMDNFFSMVQNSETLSANNTFPMNFFIDFIKMYLLIISIMIVYSLFVLASSAASIKAISIKLEQKDDKEINVFKHVLKKFLPLLGTTMISGIMMTFGFLFCYIPGLILMVYMIFVPQAVILENKYFFSAIGRSFSLVNKNFWIVALILLIFYFIYSIGLSILIAPVYLVPYIKFIMQMVKMGGETDPAYMMDVMRNFMKEMSVYIFIIIGISSIASLFYLLLINNALTIKFYNIKNLKEGTQLLSDIDKELNKT
ncbi:MAG: hypothetical protein JXB50_10335 [Spirochaetes bacterium]|nr:hypothetical protein [Spirochaetota bacterium]